MNERAGESYRPDLDPKVMRDWMRRGSSAAAFLLVIPGCAIIGYGAGLLANHSLPYSVIGFGAGLLMWGQIVSFGR
jgi:hypothetical protein